MSSLPPKVFDRELIARHFARRSGADDFVTKLALDDLATRLITVTRDFEAALIMAPDARELPVMGRSANGAFHFERAATVVDADRLAHEALADPEVVAEVVARFGAGVRDAAGRIDRKALAGLVFGATPAHDAALAALEAIVHPRVRRRIEAVLAAGGARAVVLDVPLLFETDFHKLCDVTLSISSPLTQALGRLKKTRGTDAFIRFRTGPVHAACIFLSPTATAPPPERILRSWLCPSSLE
jgi:dephospho-CoA kinase